MLVSATKQISEVLNIEESEIIYTSGSTESNNLALVGYCLKNMKKGKNIVVSRLEHPSIYGICEYLETLGFEITYVENDKNGLIDFEDLKEKVRPDTILVSIVAVNSELGIRQPLKTLRQIIKKQNDKTVFHSDMTQAIGKAAINLHDVDLASISGHKIYGPKGIGILYKSSKIQLEPIIHGSKDSLRSGTPSLPLIVAFSKALRLAVTNESKNEATVKLLNEKLTATIAKYSKIMINKTNYSIPHIFNISLMTIKPETMIHALEKRDIYVGSNTACSKGGTSSSVMAVYNDKKRADSTIRISLSHLTSFDDLNKFLYSFDIVYNKLLELSDTDE
ncbi:MAG TPA: hypothetical protein DCY94_02200 [Firmicutes bacterium]|nr:hypothetical protein [Bacillota bacterium]